MNKNQTNNLLNYLNAISYQIKFRMEKQDRKINFLDLAISNKEE